MSAGSVEPRENDKVLPRSHAIFVKFKLKNSPAPDYITRTRKKEDQPDLLDDRDWTKLLTHQQTTYREIKRLAKILKIGVMSLFYPQASTPDDADQAIGILNRNRSRIDQTEKTVANDSGAGYKPNKQAAPLEKYLKIHIVPDDENLHAPVVYESLRKPDLWNARKSSLVENQETLTDEDQNDLRAFVQHIDNAIEAAKKTPDLKPAVDTNKAGTTINDPEQIIQAAYKYVGAQVNFAKNALKKLLGRLDDPEIKSEELVDLILRHPDQPLKPLDVIQTNIIEKIYADEKFSDDERKTIIRFCDYATCIALPQQELIQIQQQIDEQLPLIKVETHDRPLIILHFTRLLPMSDYQAHEEEDPRSIIEQMPRRKLIRKNFQEISIPAEVGAGRGAGPSYKDLFIGGLAIQLNIPGFDLNLSKAIEAATGQIQAKLLDWIKPAKAIRIAVFVDENRDHDIKELKKLFPEIFFIKLPEVFNTHSYYQINNHRSDIMAAIPSDRESH